MVSLQAARLLYYLPTYLPTPPSIEALCLDDDDLVVMVMMMELAAVPLFFSSGGTNLRSKHIASFLVHIYFIPDRLLLLQVHVQCSAVHCCLLT